MTENDLMVEMKYRLFIDVCMNGCVCVMEKGRSDVLDTFICILFDN